MSAQTKTLNSSPLSNDELRNIAYALAALMPEAHDHPMNIQEATCFLRMSRKKFHHLINTGVIKPHRLEEKSNPLFLKSELLSVIKKS